MSAAAAVQGPSSQTAFLSEGSRRQAEPATLIPRDQRLPTEQRKLDRFVQSFLQLQQELADCIQAQINNRPMSDFRKLAVHKRNWKPGHVPQLAAIKAAGKVDLHSKAKVTRVLSAKQKLASLQRLKEIRAALEDAITEQQAKPPSGDSKADHQHQQDWQPNVLPRDLALERAGYMDLCMMIRGYKQMAGGPASVPTRQFVADALGYCLAGAVQKKADPAQIKQDVESLTQRMMLDPAADPADWQLGQMPRLQAIINAEESLLASQIKYFQGNRDHGRERAADFFSWTLAELVQPRLELSELADGLSMAIEEQQAIVGQADPMWQPKSVPGPTALEEAGYLDLSKKVRTFVRTIHDDDSTYRIYGQSGLADALGWGRGRTDSYRLKLIHASDVNAQKLAQDLSQARLEQQQKQKMGNQIATVWPEGSMPHYSTLGQAGHKQLAYDIMKFCCTNPRDNRQIVCGRKALAELLDWQLAELAKKSPAKSAKQRRRRRPTSSEMEVILCQIRDEQRSLLGPDHPDWQDKVLPGLTALERAGYLTVANQVKKFGIGVDGNAGVYGPKQLAAALGWKRAPRQARDVKPALTDDEVLARVREYVEQSGKHEMPSQQELKNVRKDKQHPLRECACGLATLIFNSGRTWRETAEDLGLEPRSWVAVTDQDESLLHILLLEHPARPWAQLAKEYNRQRDSLPERTASSLHQILTRAQRPDLQLVRCARYLGLSNASAVARLEGRLQRIGSDTSPLLALTKHASDVAALSARADMDPVDVLAALPHSIGSQDWIQNCNEQCEIEGQVHLWLSMSQRGRKFKLDMAEAWDSVPELQPFKADRLRLTLNSELAEALRTLINQAWSSDHEHIYEAHNVLPKFFSRQFALLVVQRLPYRECSKPNIQAVPLVQKTTKLETLQAMEYDPKWLPILPQKLLPLYAAGGPLADQPVPVFSKFWPLDFASAPQMLEAARPHGGIYQIFLCLYETTRQGRRKLVMRTEVYVGAATIVLAGRIISYVSVRTCGHPGPRAEMTKRCLFFAACEHGFEFEIRFLPLPGMTPAQIFEVESHYLSKFKWMWNKQQSCDVRTHPPLLSPARLVDPLGASMRRRIDDYDSNTRRMQGKAQLRVCGSEATAVEVNDMHKPHDNTGGAAGSQLNMAGESDASLGQEQGDSDCDSAAFDSGYDTDSVCGSSGLDTENDTEINTDDDGFSGYGSDNMEMQLSDV